MIDLLLIEAGLRLADVDAHRLRARSGRLHRRTARRRASPKGSRSARTTPVVPVSNLAALAQRAFDLAFGPERVLVCSDARMQEVYWGCFELAENGLGKVLGEEHVGPTAVV